MFGCLDPVDLFFFKIKGEIEKFIIRQPPMGEKDDYDSENSWISDGQNLKECLFFLI